MGSPYRDCKRVEIVSEVFKLMGSPYRDCKRVEIVNVSARGKAFLWGCGKIRQVRLFGPSFLSASVSSTRYASSSQDQ